MNDMPTYRVAIIGLPGSGKTTLAKKLQEEYERVYQMPVTHINADEVRKAANDWDFSDAGRLRQAQRMRDEADKHSGIVLVDFVCPNATAHEILDPHYTLWMDTIKESRFEDTNKVYEAPKYYDAKFSGHFTEHDDFEPVLIHILGKVPTGVMIGRFQPWHAGHQALFEAVLQKHGHVTIMVRSTPRNASNPFGTSETFQRIDTALRDQYKGRYLLQEVPNVAGVYYGRDVGYNVEKIELANVSDISASRIREQLRAEGSLKH